MWWMVSWWLHWYHKARSQGHQAVLLPAVFRCGFLLFHSTCSVYVYHLFSIRLSVSIILFLLGFGVTASLTEQSYGDTLWPLLPVFLTKSNGEVYKKSGGTLGDTYEVRMGLTLIMQSWTQISFPLLHEVFILLHFAWLTQFMFLKTTDFLFV